MKIYTIGYQRSTLEQYINRLLKSNIGAILDVREKAWSYKKEFCGKALQSALANVGIDYFHVRSAGNPSINRKTALTTEHCLSRYRDYLALNSTCIDEIYQIMVINFTVNKLSCLTCFEQFPNQCHRSILVEALLAQYADLETIDLFPVDSSNSK